MNILGTEEYFVNECETRGDTTINLDTENSYGEQHKFKGGVIMLKKSRNIAILSLCAMMFAVVEPAFAWGNRTGSRGGDAAAYGTAAAVIAGGVLTFLTGGLALPFIGAAAAGGAAGYYGYNVEEKSVVKDIAAVGGSALVGVGGVGLGMAAVDGAAALVAGGAATTAGTTATVGTATTAGTAAGTATTGGITAAGVAKGAGVVGAAGAGLAGMNKGGGSGSGGVSSPTSPHLPRDGSGGNWSGQRGNSNWVIDGNVAPANKLYNPDKLTWNEINAKYRNNIKSIPFKNGEPDFSAAAVDTVKIDNFTTNRTVNFKMADQNFADKLNKANGLSLTAKDIEQFRKDNNLTWHERSDMSTMDLVPSEYHSVPHSGGISNANR